MRFADFSIRNKLLASAGILFLVSVAGVSLSGSLVMSSSVEVAAEREAEALLEGYASDVAGDIDRCVDRFVDLRAAGRVADWQSAIE